jgi:hypothetical protein
MNVHRELQPRHGDRSHMETPSAPPLLPPAPSVELATAPYPSTTLEVKQDDNDRQCRICLDDEGELIAPCKCKGSSKWVHRVCLDQWRITKPDRFFTHCDICSFEYVIEDEANQDAVACRHVRFAALIGRDVVACLLLINLVIVVFGTITWYFDHESKAFVHAIPMDTTGYTNRTIYYACGMLWMLAVLGLYGIINSCLTGHCGPQDFRCCDCCRPVEEPAAAGPDQRHDHELLPDDDLRQGRRRRRRRRRGPGLRASGYSGGGGSDCCCCYCPSGGGGGGDCQCEGEGALAILVLVLIVLALIGIVVGLILGIMYLQHSIQRHARVVYKKQEARAKRVRDLNDVVIEDV